MAFRILRQRKEARRLAKIEEIFQVRRRFTYQVKHCPFECVGFEFEKIENKNQTPNEMIEIIEILKFLHTGQRSVTERKVEC